MKTKEQVLAHLKSVGYKKSEISKIMGFLIGNGTKTAKELVHYSVGDGTFDDFLNWYQSEEVEENTCPICKMFKSLFEAMDIATEHDDLEVLDRLDNLMNLMIDTFIEDVSEKDNNEQ